MGKAARKANREKRKQEAENLALIADMADEEPNTVANIVQVGNQTFAGAGSAEGIGS